MSAKGKTSKRKGAPPQAVSPKKGDTAGRSPTESGACHTPVWRGTTSSSVEGPSKKQRPEQRKDEGAPDGRPERAFFNSSARHRRHRRYGVRAPSTHPPTTTPPPPSPPFLLGLPTPRTRTRAPTHTRAGVSGTVGRRRPRSSRPHLASRSSSDLAHPHPQCPFSTHTHTRRAGS